MLQKRVLFLTAAAILSAGCVSANVVSKEEIQIQTKADNAVTGVLFDRGMDSNASYNVRKDGFVVIRFDDSVTEQRYTEVVEQLRSSDNIKGVRAELGGYEVCPLP